jgi:hypothetical protein
MTIKKDFLKEQRDSVRARRVVTVRHRLVKHNNRRADSIWQLSVSENMSLSGLLLKSTVDYKPGDIIELEVVMSGVLDIFIGFGKVIRTLSQKDGNYQIGIKYIDLKSKYRTAKTILASPT